MDPATRPSASKYEAAIPAPPRTQRPGAVGVAERAIGAQLLTVGLPVSDARQGVGRQLAVQVRIAVLLAESGQNRRARGPADQWKRFAQLDHKAGPVLAVDLVAKYQAVTDRGCDITDFVELVCLAASRTPDTIGVRCNRFEQRQRPGRHPCPLSGVGCTIPLGVVHAQLVRHCLIQSLTRFRLH
jgi:hypothetical protein